MKVFNANGALKITRDDTEVAWTDYSSISTIVGWSSFTTKEIHYIRDGNRVYAQYDIQGTSNSVNTTFTLPYQNNSGGGNTHMMRGQDNGTYNTGVGVIPDGSSTVTFNYIVISSWTASGTKRISGQFWYRTTQAP